jgi:hypothetical protein
MSRYKIKNHVSRKVRMTYAPKRREYSILFSCDITNYLSSPSIIKDASVSNAKEIGGV